jgi:mannosyltransferase
MSTLCLDGWTCADAYSFFYKHELLQKYDWYWRVEPEIKYFCDIT